MAPYIVLDHTADTGIEATAATLSALIADLAIGMFQLMATVDPCPSDRAVELEVAASSVEDLVVECLSELLYRSEIEDLLFCDIEVDEAGPRSMRIEARGVDSHQVEMTGPPIKAVTYHDIAVRSGDPDWYGRVYLDV